MIGSAFKALMVRSPADPPRFEMLDRSAFGDGEVLVEVRYSSLNYKDGLALTDPPKVIRRYPMVPGIDLAGVVLESSHPQFQTGSAVVATGYGLGEVHWGGYAELANVRAACLVNLPKGLTLPYSMTIGTAGVTAMLALIALERHGLRPNQGPVVVTGASGGVGSLAVALLARSAYQPVAVTRRAEEAEYLRQLGAAEILSPARLTEAGPKPLQHAKWAGAIDAVGGAVLPALLSSMKEGASVAVCGNAAGAAFQTTVLPFILRGVNLLGISSQYPAEDLRAEVWRRLASTLTGTVLDSISRRASFDDLPALSKEILAGRIRGRVVVQIGES